GYRTESPSSGSAPILRSGKTRNGFTAFGERKGKEPHTMIEFKSVSKWYGSFQVLTNCSTRVDKGEVVVVCGPSGSGKSTLIKCVRGREPFQQGDIVVNGESLPANTTNLNRLRSKIGMVFQSFELFPHMKVVDNVNLGQVKVLGRRFEEASA